MDTTYLSNGNSKTGDAASFDLPAISTCPGSTETCRSKCYAAKLMRIYKNVNAKYQRNYEFSLSKTFVSKMVCMLPYNGTVRIHVSGDFYSREYIEKWIEIASRKKELHFYCYTRSWTTDLLPYIQLLASLDNVTVNLSLDKDTGIPQFDGAENYLWCYMSEDDDDIVEGMRRSDIVFRANHNGHKRKRKNAAKKGVDGPALVHRMGGATVCPLERGEDIPLSCSRCRLCI